MTQPADQHMHRNAELFHRNGLLGRSFFCQSDIFLEKAEKKIQKLVKRDDGTFSLQDFQSEEDAKE